MLKDDTDDIFQVQNAGGAQFGYEATRLKTSKSNSDSSKEGVRIVLKGGKHPLKGPVKERKQQEAIIEFLCDADKDGSEGEWDAEDKYERLARRDDKDQEDEDEGESTTEHQLKKDDAALIWESFKGEKDTDVLRLTWHTKHACEDKRSDDGDGNDSTSTSWGFFTWLFIM
jgi:autophagy-related protein 27